MLMDSNNFDLFLMTKFDYIIDLIRCNSKFAFWSSSNNFVMLSCAKIWINSYKDFRIFQFFRECFDCIECTNINNHFRINSILHFAFRDKILSIKNLIWFIAIIQCSINFSRRNNINTFYPIILQDFEKLVIVICFHGIRDMKVRCSLF